MWNVMFIMWNVMSLTSVRIEQKINYLVLKIIILPKIEVIYSSYMFILASCSLAITSALSLLLRESIYKRRFMQNFCTFLFDLYEIQTDTDVVYLPSGVNNDSYDWCVQYKQRLFGLCLTQFNFIIQNEIAIHPLLFILSLIYPSMILDLNQSKIIVT